MPRNFTVVQALRGIAALWVVLFHASEGGHIQQLKASLPNLVDEILFDAGGYGVAIFFGLSGFVIAHSLANVEMRPRTWALFMLRRSVRLDPAYWAAILFAIVMALVSAKVKGQAATTPSLAQVAAHVLYIQEIVGFPQINNVFWTLSYEIQFYAFFALAMVVDRRPMRVLLFLLGVGSAVGLFDGLVPGLFLNLWGCFFVGVLARWAAEERDWFAAFVVLALVLALHTHFGAMSAGTAIALWLSVKLRKAETGLNWRWLQFLGTISYSLYLIHNPVSGAAGFISRKAFGVSEWGDLLTLLLIVCSSVLCATIFWMAIELPSHRISRKISLQRKPL
ncbi:MAG TPA: acyltransferase [Sphingomicrobium sp.]|nr:acyltransferase [Sphingomicrobium sp.]